MTTELERLDAASIRVRKARHRSVCALCEAPILVGQQIGSDGGAWSHVHCFIADRKEHMSSTGIVPYSYGEVGHDPPIHVVAGAWQGPSAVARSAAMNVSLCGKRLSRARKRRPSQHDLCRKCEDLMTQSELPIADQASGVDATAAQDYEVLTVPIGLLFVDRTPGLQRPEQVHWTKKIAAAFSWARFYENPPKVSARPDGRYHIMDGQHEVAAARLAGHGPDALVRVHVWRELSYQQEAELFGHTNRDRHAVRALDLFVADVTSGHQDAVALDTLLNTYGWKAGSAGREASFAAVTTLRRLYGKPGGPEVCDRIIATITRAWDHNPDGANRTVVSALGAFYEQYPNAEVDRLAHVLHREIAPVSMHLWPHEKSWLRVAVVRLQERYDNGLRNQSRRLVPSRG